MSQEIAPVSRRENGVNSGSYAPQFSGDGGYLLFLSHARNLMTNDSGNGHLNIYVLNLTNWHMQLVSRPTGEAFASGSSGMGSISRDGQYVVFESEAANFVAGDTNGSKDVFVRNLRTSITTLVSGNTNGIDQTQIDSFNPVLTPDGRWVAFESRVKKLFLTNPANVLNLHDLLTGTTLALTNGEASPIVGSQSVVITPDGNKVAFVSTTALGSGGAANPRGDIYVWDVQSDTISPVSTNLPASRACFFPQLSDDGNRVLFKAVIADYLGSTQVCLVDRAYQTTTCISTNANDSTLPVLSPDGRLVVSEQNGNIYLWDLQTGTNLLISVDLNGTEKGNGPSYGPVMSGDFTRVAFLSEATNLTANPCNGKPQIYVRDLALGITRLVSADTNAMGSGDFSLAFPVISPNGEMVAFESLASNLTPDDSNAAFDIFLYSWASQSVQRVSRAVPGKDGRTPARLSYSGPSSVSADGRYVAFNTLDTSFYSFGITNPFCFVIWDTWQQRNIVTNLIAQPPTGGASAFQPPVIGPKPPVLSGNGSALAYIVQTYDALGKPGIGSLYRLDLASGEQRIIGQNRNANGTNDTELNPCLSDDGRYLVFQSSATSLSGNIPDTNGQADVFLFDAVEGTTNLVSVSLTGNAAGSGASSNAFITADGRWIFFQSMSSNLCANLPPAFTATNSLVYARDRVAGKTYALGNPQRPYRGAAMPVVDLNNQVVFFQANPLGCCGGIYGFNLLTLSNFFYIPDAFRPVVSPDASFLTYRKGFSAWGTFYVYDLLRNQETPLPPRTEGSVVGGELSADISISPSGRYMVFSSTATNLVVGDANNAADVFVYDRLLGTTTLLSVNSEGTGPGSGASLKPVMSRDGKTVVFDSFAGDLIEGDYNGSRDVFVARLGTADSDNDGLDDDWEVAYFNNLSRTGSGDFDGDGQNDRQEFIAGTDPKNDGSILRVMTVSRLQSGAVTVLWNSVPGRGYRVQYKDDLSVSTWSNLFEGVVATSTIASKQDTQPRPRRFYRVITAGE